MDDQKFAQLPTNISVYGNTFANTNCGKVKLLSQKFWVKSLQFQFLIPHLWKAFRRMDEMTAEANVWIKDDEDILEDIDFSFPDRWWYLDVTTFFILRKITLIYSNHLSLKLNENKSDQALISEKKMWYLTRVSYS